MADHAVVDAAPARASGLAPPAVSDSAGTFGEAEDATPGRATAQELPAVIDSAGGVGTAEDADPGRAAALEPPAVVAAAGGVGKAADAETGAGDDAATIVNDPRVTKACKSVPADQLSVLAGIGIEQRGRERKTILKAMRAWSKENDVASSRELRSCMSSISKAVVALKSAATSLSPEDLAAAIERGAAVFTGNNRCASCHGTGGRNGRRGPRLNDAEWLHCDGSIEGIRKVISSGVPLDKLKDKSRTSAMQPAWNGPDDAQQLADVAAYVHSLSQN